MKCIYCGKEIDDGTAVCPYCGSELEAPDEEDNGFYSHEEAYDDPAQGVESKSRKFAMPKVKMPDVKLPKMPGHLELSAVISAIAALLCLICLIRIGAVSREIQAQTEILNGSISSLSSRVAALDDRLGQIDTTVAGVQSQAYAQYASQSITITKDVTPLTGPVTAGKYNVMFIVTAKGNLNVNDSFDWQKYNESTGGWVSVVFTGNATDNDEYGLRLENGYDKANNEYTTKLWANGITPAAAGTYRCVITDGAGITKTSAEAPVTVAEG